MIETTTMQDQSTLPTAIICSTDSVTPALPSLLFRFLCRQLVIKEGLLFEDWKVLIKDLANNAKLFHFWLGDCLAYGKRAYGEKYKEALAITGLSYGTLRNIASVSLSVDVSLRNDKLKFSHYVAVASQPKEKQKFYIDSALTLGLSVKELRALVHGPTEQKTVTCPNCLTNFIPNGKNVA